MILFVDLTVIKLATRIMALVHVRYTVMLYIDCSIETDLFVHGETTLVDDYEFYFVNQKFLNMTIITCSLFYTVVQ